MQVLTRRGHGVLSNALLTQMYTVIASDYPVFIWQCFCQTEHIPFIFQTSHSGNIARIPRQFIAGIFSFLVRMMDRFEWVIFTFCHLVNEDRVKYTSFSKIPHGPYKLGCVDSTNSVFLNSQSPVIISCSVVCFISQRDCRSVYHSFVYLAEWGQLESTMFLLPFLMQYFQNHVFVTYFYDIIKTWREWTIGWVELFLSFPNTYIVLSIWT